MFGFTFRKRKPKPTDNELAARISAKASKHAGTHGAPATFKVSNGTAGIVPDDTKPDPVDDPWRQNLSGRDDVQFKRGG